MKLCRMSNASLDACRGDCCRPDGNGNHGHTCQDLSVHPSSDHASTNHPSSDHASANYASAYPGHHAASCRRRSSPARDTPIRPELSVPHGHLACNKDATGALPATLFSCSACSAFDAWRASGVWLSTAVLCPAAGDTLSTVAAAQGVQLPDLLRANPQITDPNVVLAGA